MGALSAEETFVAGGSLGAALLAMSTAGHLTLRRLCAVALYVFLLANCVRAGTATGITGLYTTGIDANADARDDHWSRSNGAAAYVVSNANASNNGWYTTSGAKWISSTTSGGVWFSPGTYAYTLTFDLTGASGTAAGDAASGVSIFMTLAVDGNAAITVNGANPVNTTGASPWTQTQNVTLTNGFLIGSNTITISVQNPNWFYGTQGVLVSSISGVVPEIGTWVPLAGTFLLFGWLRLRPKGKLPLAA